MADDKDTQSSDIWDTVLRDGPGVLGGVAGAVGGRKLGRSYAKAKLGKAGAAAAAEKFRTQSLRINSAYKRGELSEDEFRGAMQRAKTDASLDEFPERMTGGLGAVACMTGGVYATLPRKKQK